MNKPPREIQAAGLERTHPSLRGLPVSAAPRTEDLGVEICAACPRMCRPWCPTSVASGDEDLHPAGLANAQSKLWDCTLCGNCGVPCHLDTDARAWIVRQRHEMVNQGQAPHRVTSLERPSEPQIELGSTNGSSTEFQISCALLRQGEGEVSRLVGALRKLGTPVRVAEGCCGGEAQALGLTAEPPTHSATSRVSDHGGCGSRSIESWITELAENGTVTLQAPEGSVFLRDCTTVDRHLGTDTMLGVAALEAGCCGAGSALDALNPELAGKVAVLTIAAADGRTIICGAPRCASHLRAHGADAMSLADLIQ